MNPVLHFLCAIIVALTVYSSTQGVNAQCLTDNDNLREAANVDLSPILEFNLNLFKSLIPSSSKKNFVFSPYSIWNALVLAYFGSGGNTEKEFRQLLSIGDKAAALKKWRSLEFMYHLRLETSVNNTFIVANRAYFDQTVKLKHCMEDILHSEIENIDFSKPKLAADTINKFVSSTTRGTIKELVSATDVHLARLVLVNAAYFKGTWTHPFDPKNTKSSTFTNFDNEKLSVEMMTQYGSFKYGFDDRVKVSVLELPYIGDAISMFLIKPHGTGKSSFDAVVSELNSVNFEKILNSLHPTNAQVSLPKFSLESFVGDELSRSLQQMGLKDAFNRRVANFSSFSSDELLSLDRSVHKAFIYVNEVGTEAGAATGFIANKIGGTALFECDRPFIFVIRDNDTKTLLFMGAYKSPDSVGRTVSRANRPRRNRNSFAGRQARLNF